MSDKAPGAAPLETGWLRAIEFKLPLAWLLSIAAALVWVLIQQYFTLTALVVSVNDLQTSVKAFNQASITLNAEQSLIKYRLENLEQQMRQQAQNNNTAPTPVTRSPR